MSRGSISIKGEGNQVYFVGNEGGIMSSNYSNQDRSINVQGDFNLNQANSVLNIGDISGALNNTVQNLKNSEQPEAPKLADLISQLQKAIEIEPSLTAEQKKDALESLTSIGEEVQKPPETRIQKICKLAVSNLKSLVPIVTTTGMLGTALKECLPQIITLLGLQ
jgi:gas vesicle protein